MDLKAEKLVLIQWLVGLNDEEIINRIKDLRSKAQSKDKAAVVAHTTDGQPLTQEAYNRRLESSEEDIREGRTYTTNEFRNQIASWKDK